MYRMISFIFMLLLGVYSLNVDAAETLASPIIAPEYIPVTIKPCYVGCDYQFPYCYHYNILNMDDAIKVKEWNVSGGTVTGKAVAEIKANLIIKMCYQVSLTSAFVLIDKEIDLTSEFEFSIKLNGDAGDICISDEESAINYSSMELKGDIKTEPIPIVQANLLENMASIIKDAVIRAVHSSAVKNTGSKKVYCNEGKSSTEETNAPCGCE